MKGFISGLLITSLMLSVPAYAAEPENDTAYDISAYTDNECLVMYSDGSIEVMSFENADALSEKIEELLKNENVITVQPNYSYTASSLETNDTLAAQQWALENDGTFKMQEEKNQFPVYDTPFGEKSMPGQWHTPDNFGRPGGNYRKYQSYSRYLQDSAVQDIDINITDAWNTYTDSGKEIVVAMIDTGIDYTHTELSGRIWTNSDEIAANGIDDDGNGYVDDVYGWNFYNNSNKICTGTEDDHGTHGAGTIVARANNATGIAGIAQSDNIKVMSVKALGGYDGSGSTESVIKAIQYAEANGASICNLSLGTSENDRALYQAMANSNMLFVVAAGNEGANNDRTPTYPASYDLENIISVANISYDGTLSYGSNYGAASVDIAAPGSYILSTTSSNGYSYMSGTSMAAPFVSAAAAMVYSHFGDTVTLADVKEIILSSAVKTDGLENAVLTGGRLDLGKALAVNPDVLETEQWEEKTTAGSIGSAPVIEAYVMQSQGKNYLVIQVSDADGDVTYVSYTNSVQTIDYFNSGNSETVFELNQNGTYTIEAIEGIYTFYAADSMGNETVYTGEIAAERNSGYGYSPDYRQPSPGKGYGSYPGYSSPRNMIPATGAPGHYGRQQFPQYYSRYFR